MSYQPGDRVTITAPGMFEGLTGTVTEFPQGFTNPLYPHRVVLDTTTPAIDEEYAFAVDMAKSSGVPLDALDHGPNITFFATDELVATTA